MTTGPDLRVEAFRRGVPVYKLAARVGLHPSVLSLYLNGHRPLPESLREELMQALEELAPAAAKGGGDGA